MKNIIIYTKSYCPYCHRAKDILNKHGYDFTEIDVEHDKDKFNEMVSKASRKTVPQIFIDDAHIGGCDDLVAYEAAGKL